jgi:NSS family neurotransmitter:Na+ symporter
MSEKRTSIHGQWSSRWVFILAATGSAVGLGNIWRFPYMAGESGGGAFLLLYVVCVLIMGIPIMMTEILLGRRGRQSPVNTMRVIAEEEGLQKHWQWLGIMGVIAGFLIVSYYSVIAGWVLAYVFRAATGSFEGGNADMISGIFSDLISDPERLLAWHTVFIMLTVIVVSRGVRSGLEQAVRFLMPALLILLLIMVGYAMSTEGFYEGMMFLLKPDFAAMTENFQEVFLNASGHAFFSLSLGMGAIMIYGSYLPDNTSITQASVLIASADTLIAILASFAIFPLVFTYGLEPGQGPGLIFVTLPIAFGQMPAGVFFGTLFFLLLLFAAWTSAISLIEPAVTWMVENWGMTRIKATAITGFLAWSLGIATILSFNHWAFPFSFAGADKNNGIFDIIDILTANIMLPLGGLIMAIFVGWLMSRASSKDELKVSDRLYKIWRFTIRYLSPIGVAIIFLNQIGVI